MKGIVESFNKRQIENNTIPEFKAGDTVAVDLRLREGSTDAFTEI